MRAGELRGAALAALAAAVLSVPPAAAAARPQRIMSMNQCTDLLLMQMVPKARIASLTYLARDGARRLLPDQDVDAPVNHGTPEDLLSVRPDLILADAASTPMTRRLARRIGAPLVEVRPAASFADIRATIRQLGEATGEAARAEALIGVMDAKLAALAALPPPARRRVVVWSGGSVPGRATLANAIVEAAGAVNVAAAPGPVYVSFDAEQVLAAGPDALLQAVSGAGPLRGEAAESGLMRRLYGARRVGYDEIAFSCGLPQSADAALALRRALDAPAR